MICIEIRMDNFYLATPVVDMIILIVVGVSCYQEVELPKGVGLSSPFIFQTKQSYVLMFYI